MQQRPELGTRGIRRLPNWIAVLALAESLPSGGRINGYQIAKIIMRAMHEDAGGGFNARVR